MKTALTTAKPFNAFAILVDINSFTPMVNRAVAGPEGGFLIADFVRDCLGASIDSIEAHGGVVVGLMGDAILGVVPNGGNRIFSACVDIAEKLDRTCEYISTHQLEDPSAWHWSPGGPSLKVCVEWGHFDVSKVSTRFLGDQRLVISNAINHAARIGKAGKGNRCLLGPAAAKRPELFQYAPQGPHRVDGKEGEGEYEYYVLDLGDIWRDGERSPDAESYWGGS